MKTLLILRHAKSSWSDSQMADFDRPLNARGKRAAPRMGRLLVEEDLVPDLIVSSSAKRARKTAQKAAKAADYQGEIRLENALYGGGSSTYLQILRHLDENVERVMVVGHNPDLEMLVEQLTGQSEILPTAALVHLRLPLDNWADQIPRGDCELVALWRPREL
jgi:phosphohistidine phosphatase